MTSTVHALFASAALITLSSPVAARAEAPEIKKWEERAGTSDDMREEFFGQRGLTGLFLAMYLAGAEVDSRYDLGFDLPDADTDADEAAAAAGRVYLERVFGVKAKGLSKSKRRTADDVETLAAAAVDKALEWAQRTVNEPLPYKPFTIAGRYVPTELPADNITAHLGHFAYDPSLATKIAPPPALDSDRYAESFQETLTVGGLTSDIRTTDEEKATIIYDLQDPHPMIYRILARRDFSLFEQARIMAIYDMAADDVTAAQFAGKLHFQSWRPITAIRRADLDGRDDTLVDPDWDAFLITPESSEYPCGHCTFVSASAEVLKAILPLEAGEEVVIAAADIYDDPDERGYDGDAKAFIKDFVITLPNYDAFAEQGAYSRIVNGAHFRYSIEAGTALGKDVAAANLKRWDGLPD